MADILFGDCETQSPIDLRRSGADFYARHPQTKALCFAFAINDESPRLVAPDETGRLTLPKDIEEFIRAGGAFVAHNAAFELTIWNHICAPRFGWPRLEIYQTHCTMALAHMMSLPGSLEKLALVLGIPIQKDMFGHGVMMRLSRPRKTLPDGSHTWWTPENAPEKFQALYSYCQKDVEADRLIYKTLLKLTPSERELWELDQRINQRGVGVDLKAIRSAIQLADAQRKKLNEEMRELTRGVAYSCNDLRGMKMFLENHGVMLPGCAKNHLIDALEAEDLPAPCRRAIQLRQEAGKTSVKKLEAMLRAAVPTTHDFGRLYGLFIYHGANTGRWVSYKVQLHNLPRSKMKPEEIDQVFEAIHQAEVA